MATSGELLLLQGKCKTDPESYYDDFHQRLRHYKSLLVRRARGCGARALTGPG